MFRREIDDCSGAIALEMDFLLARRVSYDETVFEQSSSIICDGTLMIRELTKLGQVTDIVADIALHCLWIPGDNLPEESAVYLIVRLRKETRTYGLLRARRLAYDGRAFRVGRERYKIELISLW